mmetsp:Transcript_41386/g.102881  ORF Transcript_41386/g.102881 Transcript_41386/m.102881 type:complete len:150 (-) Transcript_41386:194-643(-)
MEAPGAAANGLFYYGAGKNAPGSGAPLGSHAPWPGVMEAINISTGQVVWSTKAHTLIGYISPRATDKIPTNVECEPDSFANPSVGADGTVYFGWHGGMVYALDGRTGTVKSEYPTGTGIQANPAIGDGMVAFLTCNELIVFKTNQTNDE